ncbi:hypothetical protein PBI_NESBITT_23 [Streptomyces phage Nesbitt]|uniref:Holin n=2 Tax=Abbeymikolonvirus abbeymikolon TaxID=2734213 RepID=A0A2P1JT10_9CAUD|nr:hypothetical protein HOS57_gp23 [Streptomyces phage AbbeyMikolon]AUG87095.1 hypothetical protein SEA_ABBEYMIKOLON_23 [Streptomyces phage AbbeyMikolon]AVO22280.1 hypothetical protein PBI_NESBITT_23 [Streptomyces phage Nesbitt]
MTDNQRRTARTVFQTAVTLAAAVPALVEASGLAQTSGAVVIALAVSGAVTRIMALPVVDQLLPGWLRKEA